MEDLDTLFRVNYIKMNRLKKERLKMLNKLSDSERLELEKEEELIEIARELHSIQFEEEYDFINDSIEDSKKRKDGINPMSKEYIEKVSIKRKKLGLLDLGLNGMPVDNKSFLLCLEEVKKGETNDKN